MLDGSPYQGYLYAYPHKTAYRALNPAPGLRTVWADQRREALALYLHIPFCEARCGFCNLFTRSTPPDEQVSAYLAQLGRQAAEVADALAPARYARLAVGGGTPTYLTAGELDSLLDLAERTMGAPVAAVPTSVETSPATATPDRVGVLAGRGVNRISLGVQSFLDVEARAAGRPQRRAEVERALGTIRDAGVPVLNLDLIYGIDGQTAATWRESLTAALAWRPEEVYLYPLYVRPLTGLGRRARTGAEWDEQRMALYRQGRDTLLAEGYAQLSMRQFRRIDAPTVDGPDYCCQDDGMVGLGCGARSYTDELHYSFDYAVRPGEVRAVLADYLRRPAADFRSAEIGFWLDRDEQRRRWLLKSLLRAEGLDPAGYLARFATAHTDDFPRLAELVERGWAEPDRARLTLAGLARSDAIGPWLVSGQVRSAMTGYAPR